VRVTGYQYGNDNQRWYRLLFDGDNVGWIPAHRVTRSEAIQPWPGYLNDNQVLRSEPGMTFNSVRNLQRGNQVRVEASITFPPDGERWLYVKHGDASGWVRANLVGRESNTITVTVQGNADPTMINLVRNTIIRRLTENGHSVVDRNGSTRLSVQVSLQSSPGSDRQFYASTAFISITANAPNREVIPIGPFQSGRQSDTYNRRAYTYRRAIDEASRLTADGIVDALSRHTRR